MATDKYGRPDIVFCLTCGKPLTDHAAKMAAKEAALLRESGYSAEVARIVAQTHGCAGPYGDCFGPAIAAIPIPERTEAATT